MNLKQTAAKIFAAYTNKQTQKWANNPVETQQKVFESLLFDAKKTLFCKNHHFSDIKTFADFAKQVPVRDYEALKPYVDKMVLGEKDILWPGKPIYFAKTSGTTSECILRPR